MATITLNGQQVEVPDGVNLIEAARTVGVEIPHYCYHPGLPVDGNCRMCLCEVEGARGPQISCNTPVKDGMVVRTDTPAVDKMRKGVQELMLLNHPIDCPICDQAGECRLQDYYMEYGQYKNRSMVPKVEKNKVVDLGPMVTLDQERCILCSRCVRFCESVTKTGELVIRNRGDRACVTTFPGKSLDNAYSGNVVDVCPVGALTSKDFRFKQRVWFLTSTKSICTGCSNGCAITLDHRSGQTYRFKPRANPLVNDYWMCDAGRLSYKSLNTDRLYSALVEGAETPFGLVFDAAVSALKKATSVVVVGSAHASVETNFVLSRLAREVLGGATLSGATLTPDWEGDDFLKKADRTPNRAGLTFLGIDQDADALKAALENATAAIVVDNDLSEGGAEWAALLAKIPTTVVLTKHRREGLDEATFVLPISSHVEEAGSYVQAKGVLQKVAKAYDAEGDAAPAWQVLSRLARALGTDFGYEDVENIWTDLRAAHTELGELTFYTLPEHGLQLEAPAMAAASQSGK